ncbi:glycosyltransferase [Mycolicibacterium sp.]|uniref:glycosyltransferase n=1 Tax=Mycolicibacterium sp. TaxID=2320850 RepID=UPI003565B57A
MWFGRITPEKGTHLAIEAARRAGMPLVLAGPISDPQYFAERVEPELGSEVRYAGHLGQDALARVVGSAGAALVTPTWDEPYGLVIAEAMSCGTPVVAFDRGGVPELVGPRCGRLVPPNDVAAMARAIPEVLQLSRLVVRRHAKSRCSATAMLHSYLALYGRLIDDVRNNHDRVLRPSPRLRASGPRDEHRRADASAGHGVDQSRRARGEPVQRGGAATA